MLTPEGCQSRRRRLLDHLAEQKVDAVLLTHLADICYFTGKVFPGQPFLSESSCCVVLESAGDIWAVLPDGETFEVATDVLHYEWNQFGTLHFDQLRRLNARFKSKLASVSGWKRVGFQAESLKTVLARTVTERFGKVEWTNVDELLLDLQSVKDDDEIDCLRQAVRANLGAYDAVRAAIAPGVTETEVLLAGQRGAMATAGENVYHSGDYRCGEMNGPARVRPLQEGDIYIVDAWTYHLGYWSDLSRSFLVGSSPSEIQQSLYDHIAGVLTRVPSFLVPGKDGREVFQAVDALIREHPALTDKGMVHHAGHGTGVRVHGLPDLNRDRGGRLQPGNVLCVEPAGYCSEARAGVRLENMFWIRDDGVEVLSDYPLELT